MTNRNIPCQWKLLIWFFAFTPKILFGFNSDYFFQPAPLSGFVTFYYESFENDYKIQQTNLGSGYSARVLRDGPTYGAGFEFSVFQGFSIHLKYSESKHDIVTTTQSPGLDTTQTLKSQGPNDTWITVKYSYSFGSSLLLAGIGLNFSPEDPTLNEVTKEQNNFSGRSTFNPFFAYQLGSTGLILALKADIKLIGDGATFKNHTITGGNETRYSLELGIAPSLSSRLSIEGGQKKIDSWTERTRSFESRKFTVLRAYARATWFEFLITRISYDWQFLSGESLDQGIVDHTQKSLSFLLGFTF